MANRVVVTGLGVVSPNGIGINDFLYSLMNGISGIKYNARFAELKFNCQVCGLPEFNWDQLKKYMPDTVLYGLKSKCIGYGIMASLDAWMDAGNLINREGTILDTGCVFGSSVGDTEMIKNTISKVDSKESRKIGSRVVEQIMNSGVSAYISGRLGLGNRIVNNSAACATGTQAILMGYEYIHNGMAKRMIVGSCEFVDAYICGAFDSMRVLSRKYNDSPAQASRPMSASADGFVPSSGAGALILEDLDYALDHHSKIYAELLGGATNSGGQREGGSMTAPGSEGVIRCIEEAMEHSKIDPGSIDLISGHLTATMADPLEIQNWTRALRLSREEFPRVNSLKSMIGHSLSAAGSIEAVASVLQIRDNFVHPNLNLEDPNPDIVDLVGMDNLPRKTIKTGINVVAKANFGFGDVNACIIFSKFNMYG